MESNLSSLVSTKHNIVYCVINVRNSGTIILDFKPHTLRKHILNSETLVFTRVSLFTKVFWYISVELTLYISTSTFRHN